MHTAAPAAASASAIDEPMPLPAPVTIATFPSRSMSALSFATDDQVGDEAGPAGLVRRAEPRARVAVEVLVEEDRVPPSGILLQQAVPAEDGAPAVVAPQEERDQPPLELVGDRGQRHRAAGARRALDAPRVAEVAVVGAERAGKQVVDREPDGAAPVRVAAEERRGRLRRLVVERRVVAVELEPQRVREVALRERAQAVVGEELVLVQHRDRKSVV